MVVGNLTQVLLWEPSLPGWLPGQLQRYNPVWLFRYPATTGKLRLGEFSCDLGEFGVNATGDFAHTRNCAESDEQSD